MTQKNAQELLEKQRLGTLTDEERTILESWYLQEARSMPHFGISEKELEQDLDNIYKSLPAYETPVRPLLSRPYFKISLAAASILLFIIAGIFFNSKKTKTLAKMPAPSHRNVAPGDKRAVLTLADNTQIILDSVSLGDIARQTGITVTMNAKGQVVYKIDDKNLPANAPEQFNTITTPASGEYQVQLSDGTTVWLNAMSSIRFPTAFKGNDRRIEITGEAYFEVAKNAAKPFRVVSGKQVVEVLGTHFNINAYADEQAVKTTLTEGSVKVSLSDGKNSKVLKPGEQSLLPANQDQFSVEKVDLEEAVAWKNGYFIFADEELKSVMRKIARWYNVEVEYQGINENLKLGGAIARSRDLSEVLDLLELTDNVKFKMEGRRIIVMR